MASSSAASTSCSGTSLTRSAVLSIRSRRRSNRAWRSSAAGAGCGGTDDILIRSSVAATQRAWSGTGTFTLKDVDVKDQAGTAAITAYNSTNTGNNGANWTFAAGCPPPALDTDVRTVYGTSTAPADDPRTRTWDQSASSWSVAEQTIAANSTVRWVVNALSPTGTTELVGVLSDTGTGSDLDLLRWNGTTWTVDWSSTAITQANTTKRGFDLEYEALSGEALVVYSTNTATPQYRTWNGTSWSAPANVVATAPGSGVVEWVELERRPGTNELVLVYADSNQDLFGILWTGASWDEAGSETTFTTSLSTTTKAFDAAKNRFLLA